MTKVVFIIPGIELTVDCHREGADSNIVGTVAESVGNLGGRAGNKEVTRVVGVVAIDGARVVGGDRYLPRDGGRCGTEWYVKNNVLRAAGYHWSGGIYRYETQWQWCLHLPFWVAWIKKNHLLHCRLGLKYNPIILLFSFHFWFIQACLIITITWWGQLLRKAIVILITLWLVAGYQGLKLKTCTVCPRKKETGFISEISSLPPKF